ncbi:WxL domain-containing protein [Xylocopilactobacillus apicola]|uniref:WxL domain-containing protein n=1 Tax=Xylocopilactobacillus apicola TaxID=2932184 RepID=A0AAU9DU96_9LACO|nr:WxL domain-containing protein [Xylocopilactobacillus apicola]BDR59048.1 hypothetical protein XA3_14890 [Xylocopilactobacillus apicola]
MKKEKGLIAILAVGTSLISGGAIAYADKSEAVLSLTAPDPSGSLAFSNISTNAKITFASTKLNETQQTVSESTPGTAETNGFLKNGMQLKIMSANVAGKGNHTHTQVTLSNTAQNVFSGKYESGVTAKEVTLNPTLTIPASFTTGGNYKADLEWTLTPNV